MLASSFLCMQNTFMHNILIVEDEIRVAAFLEKALIAEGHQVTLCHAEEEFKQYLSSSIQFDVIILDRLLKNYDTFHDLQILRKNLPHTAILILSAIHSPSEKAQALDSGADDYMGKPFSIVELTARIRTLLRRQRRPRDGEGQSHFIVENLSINLLAQHAHIEGINLDLSAKEFKLLVTLARRPGQVYSKMQLLDSVWDINTEIESNVVETTIYHLRKKLEQLQSKCTIHVKRNMGYWIA